METVILAVIGFFLFGLVSAAKQKGKGPRQPSNIPWRELFPAEPEPVPMEPGEISGQRRESPTRETHYDPDKDLELYNSSGVEGAWGDEGRSSAEYSRLGGKNQTVQVPDKKSLPPLEAKPEDDYTDQYQFLPVQDGLIQGIVWAEILGKPRAKRYFRGPR